MCDVIKISLKRMIRGEVGKETSKKEMDNRYCTRGRPVLFAKTIKSTFNIFFIVAKLLFNYICLSVPPLYYGGK